MIPMARLHRPNDKNLPYFAYDAFKPEQVAFPIITHFVDHIERFEIDYYELKHRNGIPMVVEDTCSAPIKGWLIYFNNNLVKIYKNKKENKYEFFDAYDFICKTKPKSLFKWRKESYDGIDFNITLGKEKDYGVPYKMYKGDYDGRNDPTFYELLDYVEEGVEALEIRNDYDTLYKLQMYYTLLWSSIDKYLFLCNGGWFQHNNVIEWSKWEEFKIGFRGEINRSHVVHSTNSNKKCTLDPSNSTNSAEYYYQLRCNIVHSGKKHHTKVYFIEESIKELLTIFRNALDVSFYPQRYEEYHLSDWRKLIK